VKKFKKPSPICQKVGLQKFKKICALRAILFVTLGPNVVCQALKCHLIHLNKCPSFLRKLIFLVKYEIFRGHFRAWHTTACVYGGCAFEARPCPRGRNEVK
jgi:hypothetical protein